MKAGYRGYQYGENTGNILVIPDISFFGIFGVIFAISVCFLHFFVFFGCIFLCLIMKIFGVHLSSIFCVLFYFFCVHFLHFLLLPIVEVDISDIAIISVIPDMLTAIISGITNTPQKTYRIAQQILGIGHTP